MINNLKSNLPHSQSTQSKKARNKISIEVDIDQRVNKPKTKSIQKENVTIYKVQIYREVNVIVQKVRNYWEVQ